MKPNRKPRLPRTAKQKQTSTKRQARMNARKMGRLQISNEAFMKTTTIEELVTQARENPVACIWSCKRTYKRLRSRVRYQRYEILAGAYAAARQLQANKAEWKKFVRNPYWSKRNKKPLLEESDKALHFVVMCIFEPMLGYDRAWKNARALEFLMDRNVPAEKVPAKIVEAGGIDALVREAATRRRTKTTQEPDDREEDDGYDGNARIGPKNKAGRDDKTLHVEISPELLSQVLSLSKGEEAELTIKNVGRTGKFQRIEAIDMQHDRDDAEFASI